MGRIKKIIKYVNLNFFSPKIKSLKNRDILKQNLILKDKYKGKRCFIIGGGPSLANIDLSLLKNEYTFVVNEFNNNPQAKKIRPSFHIFSDSAYFTEGDSQYWPEQFKMKDSQVNKDVTLFVNLDAKNFVEKNNMFTKHKIYYIGTQGIMGQYFDFNINLDKYLPWPKNSILLCLMIASYLGFEEIYLLGCEHNFLGYMKPGQYSVTSFGHAEMEKYDNANDEVVKTIIVKREQNVSYEDVLAHILQLFKNYRFFYRKARLAYPNLKIYNATPESYLDVFPQIKFEQIKL